MAISKDAYTTIGSGTGNISGTHTTAGSPKGVFILIQQFGGSTDEVTGVTYGSVTCAEVTGSPALKGTGETGGVYLYFLGESIPSGNQTVAVTANATGSTKAVHCVSVTAAADTEIVDSDGSTADSSNGPAIALSFGGRSCFVFIGGISGENDLASTSPNSGWTFDYEGDAGTIIGIVSTYDTVGTSDVTAGWTQSSDDHIAVAAAIAEKAGSGTSRTPTVGSVTLDGVAGVLGLGIVTPSMIREA